MVLMRNSAVEKSLNRKTRVRYLGPLVVVSRNKGGAYILAELDGAVFDRPIAAYRVIPYIARVEPVVIPDGVLDVPPTRISEMEASEDSGEEDAEHATTEWAHELDE